MCPPKGFPGGSDDKESACNAGDSGSIPGLERSLGERNGYPLQDSCLESPMERGHWLAIARGVVKLDMTERLNTHTHKVLNEKQTYLLFCFPQLGIFN